MPTFYLDASAVVKRYVSEMDSAWVQALCGDWENTLIMAEITLAEVASAFARASRGGRISAEERLSYLDLFIGDCAEQYRLVAIERTIIDRAVDLTQSHYLRLRCHPVGDGPCRERRIDPKAIAASHLRLRRRGFVGGGPGRGIAR